VTELQTKLYMMDLKKAIVIIHKPEKIISESQCTRSEVHSVSGGDVPHVSQNILAMVVNVFR
jgi:hypothetical protein